jgi:hypothetical protein
MHDAWGLYDVRPLGATSAETEDVKITPSENEANVTWPSVSGAASYELVIKDKDGNIVCTLIFNANGQLTSIAFYAPSRNGVPVQTQNAGFSFTITGLDSGTGYDLTLSAKDNSVSSKNNIYNVSIWTLLLNVSMIIYLFSHLNESKQGIQIVEKYEWMLEPNIDIFLGVDIFSMLLILIYCSQFLPQ